MFFAASLCVRDLRDLVSPERDGAALPLTAGPDGGPEVRGGGAERDHPPGRGEARHLPEAGGLHVHRDMQRQEDQGRDGGDPAQEDPAA